MMPPSGCICWKALVPMCQPKPGPRCSNHGRSSLDTAHTMVERAEADLARIHAQLRHHPVGSPERTAHIETIQTAQATVATAQAAFAEASLAYDSTPAGMLHLRAQIAEATDEGRDATANRLQSRLEVGAATRKRQVADLAAVQRYKFHITTPNPAERAALDQVQARVREAEEDCRTAYTAQDLQSAAMRDATTRVRAAQVAQDEAHRAIAAAVTTAQNAREQVVAEATRLYVEAGVSPRFAGFYAADMAEAASRRPGRGSQGPDGREDLGPMRAAVVKVKASGPDRDKTLAAAQAAETDEAFQFANTTMVDAVAAVSEAQSRHRDAAAAADTAYEHRQATARSNAQCRYAVEDTTNHLSKVRDRQDDALARIGSGIGLAPTTILNMDQAGDEIVRNPDGSINAYVYQPPSDHFVHGRYVRAVGLTTADRGGSANALVLENGDTAYLARHYARTSRGAREQVDGFTQVVLTPPADGATPLRHEGMAGVGFSTFVDSTD